MARPDTREALIKAGLQVLHSRGFNGCGVQEITEAAGVPKGSFYNHFDSKEAFGVAVLERYCEQARDGSMAPLSDERLSPLARLKAHFGRIGEVLAAQGCARGCLVGNLSTELSDHSRLMRDRLARAFAAWTRLVAGCIREAQAAGEVRTDLDPTMLAGFLINAWEGAILRAKVERDTGALEQFQTVVFGTLLA